MKEQSASWPVSSPEHFLVSVTDKISQRARGWGPGGRECHQMRGRGSLFSHHLGKLPVCRAGRSAVCSLCWARRRAGKTVKRRRDRAPESVSANQLVIRKLGLPRGLSGKEPACQAKRHGFNPWGGKAMATHSGVPD